MRFLSLAAQHRRTRPMAQIRCLGAYAGICAFFGMLAVFAACETSVRRDREAEGIRKARRSGVYKGGVKRIDRDRVKTLAKDAAGPSAIAREMGISRRQVYRILEEDAA